MLGNHYKQQLHSGAINFTSDTFRIILMGTGFTYDPDAHDTLAAVTASQLATGNGYTQDSKTLAGVQVTRDNTNDRSEVTWDNAVWTASGGSIGPAAGAIVYDDTTADDTVVGYIDFSGDQTATDGGTFTVANPTVRLS